MNIYCISNNEYFLDFPKYNSYNKFNKTNYTINQLKKICKFYKLKTSGNKHLLKERIFIFLHKSYNASIIQKNIRRFFILKLIKLRGPALFNKNCINDTDFYTLENINNIKFNNFFSYKSNDNNIWGFDILSIYNLFLKSEKLKAYNPYNRELININIFNKIKDIIRISKILNFPIDTEIREELNLSITKKIEIQCLELFQYIDSLGNYTDLKWFLSLNRNKLIDYILNLYDIWNYRSQISDRVKRQINYPYGNPFRFVRINEIYSYNLISLQKNCLIIIEQFIKTGITINDSNLGAMYVLTAFTMVHNEAAEIMPWLYESVAIV